jgi:hypothetical protein
MFKIESFSDSVSQSMKYLARKREREKKNNMECDINIIKPHKPVEEEFKAPVNVGKKQKKKKNSESDKKVEKVEEEEDFKNLTYDDIKDSIFV